MTTSPWLKLNPSSLQTTFENCRACTWEENACIAVVLIQKTNPYLVSMFWWWRGFEAPSTTKLKSAGAACGKVIGKVVAFFKVKLVDVRPHFVGIGHYISNPPFYFATGPQSPSQDNCMKLGDVRSSIAPTIYSKVIEWTVERWFEIRPPYKLHLHRPRARTWILRQSHHHQTVVAAFVPGFD